MAGPIELIVFDLGGVLIDIDRDGALDWLLQRGYRVAELEDFVARTGLDAHERGELDADAFLARVNALLTRPANPAMLARWWTGFFAPQREMLALARALRGAYRVCILSNTGSLHWARAREQFALDEVADAALTSFEAGVRKPDAAIYRLATQRFGARPDRTVFIDDDERNVIGARAAGWQGVHHRDCATTRRALRSLGVSSA